MRRSAALRRALSMRTLSLSVVVASVGLLFALGILELPFSVRGAALKVFGETRKFVADVTAKAAASASASAPSSASEDTAATTTAAPSSTTAQATPALRHKVMYGIFTSGLPRYRRKLEAVQETWAAKPIQEGRFFAVAGRSYPAKWLEANGSVHVSRCIDQMQGICCKEVEILAEGYARGADWLFITGEDNFVDTAKMDQVLLALDASKPIAYGCVGCGAGANFCPLVRERGGFCGGCGYALSRAALQALLKGGKAALLKEYTSSKQYVPNDMRTSCALRERDVPLQGLPGGRLVGGPTFGKLDFLRGIDSGVLVFHYVPRLVFRWLHAAFQKASKEELEQLEEEAFDRGCAIGMNTTHWMDSWKSCLARHAKPR